MFASSLSLLLLGSVASVHSSPVSRHMNKVNNKVNSTAVSSGSASTTMDCGSAAVCGLLVIETGLGSGVYQHDYPSVHGLWPEVSPYGNSECRAPSDDSDPTTLYDCYNTGSLARGITQLTPMEFEVHEWEAHGICAGVQDADDFFTQLCSLAATPISLLGQPSSLSEAVTVLESAGYEVFAKDTTNSQVELSACLTSSGLWILTPVSTFDDLCAPALAKKEKEVTAPVAPRPVSSSSTYLDCAAAGVSVCGLLVIETGLGSGVYSHDSPSVHGLWPEVSPYGTSECVAPSNTADPTKLYSCYNTAQVMRSTAQLTPLEFQVHEWEAHGLCAGVKSADDFFTQLCSLAAEPLRILGSSLSSLSQGVTLLENAGYEVFATDTSNSQIELSACRTSSGVWKLAPVSDFSSVC